MQLVFEILQRLVTAAVADPDPAIRFTVLSCLDPKTDKCLAQQEVLQILFAALNDESVAVREVAIQLLGRLSTCTPASVTPFLRKTLIQLLSELKVANPVGSDQEQSARLLGMLVASSKSLIRPYVNRIIEVLIPKLEEYVAPG